ncbi:MAG: hypothetical protein HUU46_05390 [Candidatus Hydrogenedentes bacterium]|nr:hypothetical protein [Candidatus Hydrogenedentota bacterium]
MLTQFRWRVAGAILIVISGGMAFFGVRLPILHESRAAFLVYWLVFLVALIAAIYCALLDLRYIRVRMAMEERELFRDTLGDESFRKALREAQAEEAEKRKHNNTP